LTYNGHIIEVDDNFNYLGTVFNDTGNFSLSQENLIGKALKDMYTAVVRGYLGRMQYTKGQYAVRKNP